MPRELMLARIAALIAVDAPPASYPANAGAAADSGITADDIQAVMIGVAPVVGTPRVVAAAGNILRALGFEIMVAEAEMAEEEAAPGSRLGLLSGIQVSRVAAGDTGLVAELQHWLTAAAGIRSSFLSSASGLPAE